MTDDPFVREYSAISIRSLLAIAMRFARDPLSGRFLRLCESICAKFEADGCAIALPPTVSTSRVNRSCGYHRCSLNGHTRVRELFASQLTATQSVRRLNEQSEGGPAIVVSAPGGKMVLYRDNALCPFAPQEADLVGELWRACAEVDEALLENQLNTTFIDLPLSPRHSQVLGELLRGLTEKEIASNFRISYYTVHMHVKCIYRRLGVSSRAQLLAKCLHRTHGGCLPPYSANVKDDQFHVDRFNQESSAVLPVPTLVLRRTCTSTSVSRCGSD
jgi:DNA-binding CsgD family transcriptional regulator